MGKRRKKIPTASEMGKKGGKARAQRLSPEQRKEIARKGGLARWAKREKE